MTPPIQSRRRRAASLIVLIVAALASLGTSASPQPPPAMTDTVTGTIQVTADDPVATVDVSVTVNAALRSAPSNSTEVRIGATNTSGLDTATTTTTTLTTIEALDGPAEARTDPFPSLVSYFDPACGSGDCTRRYRITVVLTDPDADRASFDWAAAASSRFGPGGATGSPPPDARLGVTAQPAVLVPSARLTRTVLTPDPVRVDATIRRRR